MEERVVYEQAGWGDMLVKVEGGGFSVTSDLVPGVRFTGTSMQEVLWKMSDQIWFRVVLDWKTAKA
jgi:hypothetical protein